MDAEGNTSAPAQHILCVYMMLPPAIAVQGIQTHSAVDALRKRMCPLHPLNCRSQGALQWGHIHLHFAPQNGLFNEWA